MHILCFIDLDRIFCFIKIAIMGLDQKLVDDERKMLFQSSSRKYEFLYCNLLILCYLNPFMQFYRWLARRLQSTFTVQTLNYLTFK